MKVVNGKIIEEAPVVVDTRINEENLALQKNGLNVIRRLVGLAFLKHDQIQEGYECVVKYCADEHKELMAPLFEYYQSYWLETVGPENFSVYRVMAKTNNNLESYHKFWRQHLEKHPNLSTFVGNNQNSYV